MSAIPGAILVSDDEARSFYNHAETGAKSEATEEYPEYSLIQPGDLQRLCMSIVGLRAALNAACGIIEIGDQRLLASDGPVNGRPPELSLAEWRKLYRTLDTARSKPSTKRRRTLRRRVAKA